MLDFWWAGYGACQCECLHGRQDPLNGFCQHLCPQGEFWLPSASPRGSPRSANGYDPGSFQIAAFAMGLGACDFACILSQWNLSFLQPSGSHLYTPHWPSKSAIQGAHLCVGPLSWGAKCGIWTPHFLEKTHTIVIILLFLSYLLRVWVLTILRLHCFYQSCGSSFFISLTVKNLFC